MPKKILIIEDEIISALGLMQLLESWGYSVIEPALTARDAVAKAESERPDLVLSDVELSEVGMDGVEAARQVHARTGAKVIFVSGYPENLAIKADINWPYVYFSKPLDLERLKEEIERLIGKP